MRMKDALKLIYEKQREMHILGGVISLLDWDQKTCMPRKGLEDRSIQISYLSKKLHDLLISDELYRAVEFLDARKEDLSSIDRIVVERLKRDVEKARKIPSDFVERLSKLEAISYSSWVRARERSRFDLFLPYLSKLIELKMEYCNYKNLGGHLYNNLIDDYEEGMRYERLKPCFDFLKHKLKGLLDKLEGDFDLKIDLDVRDQERMSEIFLRQVSMDRERFRIDTSEHPFTARISTHDVRITTRYLKDKPLSSFFSTLHEVGHAIYELNLPKGRYRYTVISDAPSLGIHESQARFWENIVGRSHSFWKFFYPLVKKRIHGLGVEMEDIYRYVNQVRRSVVRVEADEVSYNLHIILRSEIESGIFEQRIDVRELREVWNEKMEELLGVRPESDREGILQDMHWSTGDFGYFPSYTIGNIYSAQLMYAMERDMGSFHALVEDGRFGDIKRWLFRKIHRFGRMFDAEELIRRSCGEGLNPERFIRYLEEKFDVSR